jgi:hypothetical protein
VSFVDLGPLANRDTRIVIPCLRSEGQGIRLVKRVKLFDAGDAVLVQV